jgi:protein-tyrosine phosphatase
MAPRIYWVETPGLAGRIAVTARPRGGPGLADDVKAWRMAGVDAVASCLETDEIEALGLEQEAELCAAAGIAFLRQPVPDLGIPLAFQDWQRTVRSLAGEAAAGRSVVAHCWAGMGRSPTLIACTLVELGWTTGAAIEAVSAARTLRVPETPEQVTWIKRYAQIRAGIPGSQGSQGSSA